MTVTLPSLGRMALALAMIAAAFFGGLALGHSHRPAARTIAPGGPVPLQRAANPSGAPAITAPADAPSLPTLKVAAPRARVVRRGVI